MKYFILTALIATLSMPSFAADRKSGKSAKGSCHVEVKVTANWDGTGSTQVFSSTIPAVGPKFCELAGKNINTPINYLNRSKSPASKLFPNATAGSTSFCGPCGDASVKEKWHWISARTAWKPASQKNPSFRGVSYKDHKIAFGTCTCNGDGQVYQPFTSPAWRTQTIY